MSLREIQIKLNAPKNQYNNFGKYNYRSCEDILEALKPLLGEHNATLTISDEVMSVSVAKDFQGPGNACIPYIESRIDLVFRDSAGNVTASHECKAQAGIEPNKKGMDIAQSFGASSSYARKYALNAMFLIDDNKDADATNTHGKEEAKETQKPGKAKSQPVTEVPRDVSNPDDFVMHFGKNKGKKLGECEADYLKWLRETWMPRKLEDWNNGKQSYDTDVALVGALKSYENVNQDTDKIIEEATIVRGSDALDPDDDVPF